MEIGLGILGWSPDAFWAATPGEVKAAIDGYMEAQGKPREKSAKPMSRERLEYLRREYPDGGSIKKRKGAKVFGGRRR